MRFVTVVLTALAFAGSAQANAIYSDTTGQAAECPVPMSSDVQYVDISTVTISNDPQAGTLTFQVSLVGAPPLTGSAAVHVLLSPVSAWGTSAGYALVANESGASLHSLDGSATGATVASTYTGGVVSMTVHTADIGSPADFAFEAPSVPGYVGHPKFTCEDTASDSPSPWTYTLSKVAPPANAPTVTSLSARFSGAHPKPGHAFSATALTAQLSTGSAVAARDLTCTGALGTRLLKGTGSGGCTFRLPKNAKKTELTVTTSGRAGSETVTRTDSFAIG